jgi:serine/threonine protein phosphatase PrpC
MAFHVELEFAAKSHTGLVRSHNEDAVAISHKCGFTILADGMGGYNAGEIASGIATSVLKETLEERLSSRAWDAHFNRSRRLHQIVQESIAHTNESIIEAARLEPSYSGMGTTLVAALFYYDKVTIAHIGDSRVYRMRGNETVQLTRDHSLLQEQVDAGILTEEEAQFSLNKNLITRAMGIDLGVQVELNDFTTEENDIYILCSDGLSDMLSAQEMSDLVNTYRDELDRACDELINRANNKGGRDNISVVVTKVRSGRNSSSRIKQFLSRLCPY